MGKKICCGGEVRNRVKGENCCVNGSWKEMKPYWEAKNYKSLQTCAYDKSFLDHRRVQNVGLAMLGAEAVKKIVKISTFKVGVIVWFITEADWQSGISTCKRKTCKY